MLRTMQESAGAQPSLTSSDFAGLLAALTASNPADQEEAPQWNLSALDEDVVSLSHERALRARAEYLRAEAGSDGSPANPDAAASAGATAEAPRGRAEADAATAANWGGQTDRDRRTSSITIRLSKAECAQIHRRAAEAGLTVSAFLRSCVLEAEALRTQVKQALAELKAESAGGRKPESAQASPRGADGVRLRRVLARIGRLWVGIAPDDAA